MLELIKSESSNEMLLEHFDSIDAKIPLLENKVIFLGDGDAGKTTIIYRIMKNNEILTEDDRKEIKRTPGIAIKTIQIADNGDIISNISKFSNSYQTVKFWDFGGQEILHSMHRCFLTENSTYVIVVCGRSNELDAKVRFWLDNVKDFAPSSRVIIVVNKTDQFIGEYLNIGRLREDYKDFGIEIIDSLRLSARRNSKEAFSELSNKIFDLAKLNQKEFLSNWINARKELDSMSANYIDEEAYQDLCVRHGIENPDDFLEMLRNLGVVFTTKNKYSPLDPDYKVLKPKWLINAIYAIIENGQAKLEQINGLISIADIKKLLKNPATFSNPEYSNTKYEPEETRYILTVMRQHEISLEFNSTQEFIPTLCKKEESEKSLEFENQDTLKYRMYYNNLPSNVIHRLMLRFKDNINRNDYSNIWVNGCIFEISGCKVLVRRERIGSTAKGNIHILVNRCSPDAEVRNSLQEVREKLYEINGSLRISATDYIIYEEEVDGKKESGEVDYETLLKQYRKGISESWVGGGINNLVSISKILKFARSDFEIAVIEKSEGKLDDRDITLDAIFAAVNSLCESAKETAESNRDIAASSRELAETFRDILDVLNEKDVDAQNKRKKFLNWLNKAGSTFLDALAKALVSYLLSNL